MNKEKQRIAIAKVHGWRCIWESSPVNYFRLYAPKGFLEGFFYTDDDPDADFPAYMLPDYLNDLNAMHEVEKMLTADQWYEYDRLMPMRDPQKIHATAAQKSEALLKVLNLWEDE